MTEKGLEIANAKVEAKSFNSCLIFRTYVTSKIWPITFFESHDKYRFAAPISSEVNTMSNLS